VNTMKNLNTELLLYLILLSSVIFGINYGLIFINIAVFLSILIIVVSIRFIEKNNIIKFLCLEIKKNSLIKFLIASFWATLILLINFSLTIYLGGIIIIKNYIMIQKIFYSAKIFVFLLMQYLIISLIEETIFRGYILKKLSQNLNTSNAIFLTSVLFSLMHIPNILENNVPDYFIPLILFNLFLLSFVLCKINLKNKTLWAPIGFSTFYKVTTVGFIKNHFVQIDLAESLVFGSIKWMPESSLLFSILIILFITLEKIITLRTFKFQKS